MYRVSVGEPVSLGAFLPKRISSRITAHVSKDSGENLRWRQGAQVAGKFSPFLDETPIAALPGSIDLDLRLFGIVPLKRVTLDVVPPVQLVAGGHSIGVLLQAKGVLVVGYANVATPDRDQPSPARQAGIQPGDVILRIENIAVQNDTQVSSLIDQLARKKEMLRFQVKRKGKLKDYLIKPEFCRETRRYRIGLYIRDGAAGVGTLTFFEPVSKKYGALGHVITNSETNESLDLRDGKIVGALVQGIRKGERGRIGEKIGLFLGGRKTTGSIEKNSRCGIFGRLDRGLSNPRLPGTVPAAMGRQVREGEAEILTVLNGEKIESFRVEIQSVFPQPRPDGKSFIIKITDPDLLRRAGGIVQGMSGSPVIQNGKLVGAVTHVFVNDPTRGYGVLAEIMLEEAGLLSPKRSVIPGLVDSQSNNKI